MVPYPIYREAYQCLDIFEVQAAWFHGERICEFFNERRWGGGQVAILDAGESSLGLVYWLHWPPNPGHSAERVRLPFEAAGNAVYKERIYWLCPECGCRRKKLYFKAVWLCAECHGLLYWTQLVPPDVAEYEGMEARQRELKAFVGGGRRSRMRYFTYQALRKELAEIDNWLKNAEERRACQDHRHFMTGEWRRPEDPGEWWIEDYMIRDDKIVAQPKY